MLIAGEEADLLSIFLLSLVLHVLDCLAGYWSLSLHECSLHLHSQDSMNSVHSSSETLSDQSSQYKYKRRRI